MRLLLWSLLLLCLITSSLAQKPRPNFGSATVDIHTHIQVAVKGLQWNAALHRQEAVFAVSATLDDPSQIPAGYVKHDKNDTTKSWYLTYFDNPHGSPAPTGAQPTQDGTMKIGNQPLVGLKADGTVKGTTIAWTLPGNAYSANSLATQVVQDPQQPQNPNAKVIQQPLTVNVSAEGDFQDGTPKVHFHFDDGVISGDADDDSDSTQYSVTDPMTHITTWLPIIYKISGHVPGRLVDAGDSQEGTHGIAKPQTATYWTNEQWYRYILQDTKGAAMPGVWVQERFTDSNPLNITVNASGKYWTATLLSTPDSGSVNLLDGIWTGPNGKNWDVLWYAKWPANDSSDAHTTHTYYAGTSDASPNATSGVILAKCDILFVAGTTTTPGTASQTSP